MTPAIREAGAADAAAILECLAEAFAPFRSSYTAGALLDTVLTPETLKHRMKAMTVFVAVIDGKGIVGTAACGVVGDGEGHLRGMAVKERWQGAGVAARLLERTEAELLSKGCLRITLDTTAPLERAMVFYEKHGYRRSGAIRDFFGMKLFEYVKTFET